MLFTNLSSTLTSLPSATQHWNSDTNSWLAGKLSPKNRLPSFLLSQLQYTLLYSTNAFIAVCQVSALSHTRHWMWIRSKCDTMVLRFICRCSDEHLMTLYWVSEAAMTTKPSTQQKDLKISCKHSCIWIYFRQTVIPKRNERETPNFDQWIHTISGGSHPLLVMCLFYAIVFTYTQCSMIDHFLQQLQQQAFQKRYTALTLDFTFESIMRQPRPTPNHHNYVLLAEVLYSIPILKFCR